MKSGSETLVLQMPDEDCLRTVCWVIASVFVFKHSLVNNDLVKCLLCRGLQTFYNPVSLVVQCQIHTTDSSCCLH